MGEAAESDDWFIDQAVAEYEAYCAGELRPSVNLLEAPEGEVQYCGRVEDRSRWTVAYVRAADRVVTPLAVGDFEHVRATFTRLDRAKARIENPDLFPPPAALVGGVRYQFRAVQGCSLVGVVQVGKAAVLLSALGERLAVVYLEGKKKVVLDVKPPLGLRVVDVDRMLRFHRPATSTVGIPVHPSTAIQAHHIRIVRGVPVHVGAGPSISEVLRSCFEDLVRRVEAQRKPRQKLKGKTKLRKVLGVLLKLGRLGCNDLVGLGSEIIAEIKGHVPEFDITAEALADVLNLLRATKTCLIERGEKERIWRIRLVGLNDPRSDLHVRLCKETKGCFRINEEAANNETTAGYRPEAGGARPTSGSASTKATGRRGKGSRAPPGPGAGITDATDTVTTQEAPVEPGSAVAAADATAGAARVPDAEPSSASAGVEDAEPVMGPTADTAAGADPLAALGQLIVSSPMLLLAATLAVLQVSLAAEQDRISERAAWEAERDALRARIESAAGDRTESPPAAVHVAELGPEVASNSVDQDPARETVREDGTYQLGIMPNEASQHAGSEAAQSGDARSTLSLADQSSSSPAESLVLHPRPYFATAGQIRRIVTLALDATAEAEHLGVPQPDLTLAHRAAWGPATDCDGLVADDVIALPASLELHPKSYLPLGSHLEWRPALRARRTMAWLPLDPPPATGEAGASADMALEQLDDEIIACVGPATFPGPAGLGSLGPRGPPDSRR